MDINEKIASYPGPNGSSSEFPGAGVRVLVVDDDMTCLYLMGMKLKISLYEVRAVPGGNDALEVLRETRGGFDVVVTDIHMPGMDGFELMDRIHQEFNLPVVLITGDTSTETADKGIQCGANLFLTKPVTLHDVRTIWQHARKNKSGGTIEKSSVQISPLEKVMEEGNNSGSPPPSEHQVMSSRVKICKRSKEEKGKNRKEQRQLKPAVGKPKKKRVVWTDRLHNLFLEAVEKIGFDYVVPKKIFNFMRVPGLTRENIASHLQKFRKFLKKHKVDEEYLNLTTTPSAYQAFVTSEAASDHPSYLTNAHQSLPGFSVSSQEGGYNTTQAQSGQALQQQNMIDNNFGLEFSSEYVRRHMLIKRSTSGRGVMQMVHEENLARNERIYGRGRIDYNANSGIGNMRSSFVPQYPVIGSSRPINQSGGVVTTSQLLPPTFGNLAVPEYGSIQTPNMPPRVQEFSSALQNGGYQFVQQPRFPTLPSAMQNEGYQFAQNPSFQVPLAPSVHEYAPPMQNGGYESVQNPSFQMQLAQAVQEYEQPMQNGGYESVQNPSFQTPLAPLVQDCAPPTQNGGYESVQNPSIQAPLAPLVQNGGYQVVPETSIRTPVLTPPPPVEAAAKEQNGWNEFESLFNVESFGPIAALNSNDLVFNEDDLSTSFMEALEQIGDKNGYGEFDANFDMSELMQANNDNAQP